ncbi:MULTISPECIES: TetR/AcrR family transcriptional regulator [unclassified Bradyrhizobium]|uniref:TetR/AcrR family transcriptional regulator n=1 Tax=unclassified Bradyrhizobium TaxID=2631580 RepID=UPI00247AA875|nr:MULTISPECIES: TetR/AcrR family transcriptional regulator [unclassified Bradyrhizobium]WGR74165.1 TetR/AcrR family transcriptional regulator [Bradyrhizobium sp. ISRA426]WGR79000.1 TetR/AcrR family transcriptional regulator [Bradyrhizobium sp. ISRA430]WGR89404.1 TetR/AcrR family transcriptional regulator [Bradyrhizobium sp. ISRA432]
MAKTPIHISAPPDVRTIAKGGASKAGGDAVAGASNRAARAAERRAAIVEAALEEFIARGFAATRLDDIAKRAGVAKGTIYLHFKDKESMFEELVRIVIVPVVEKLTTLPPPTGSVRDLVESFASNFLKEVANTRRGDLVRLIVAEGPRFPAVADFYYREVVSRGIAGMRALIELGIARGEIQQKNLARFPQILVAPAMIAVIWQSLFARHAPLDAQEMLRVHLDLIFGERRTT